ncbi:uncharacterized protein LY79DRAFT_539044 [Colletotrichum navitas]|uniref:Uncharacterized protein n=1 Tax=Colletotrichum navitas TaxID=681940 RepID=A0AAD8QAE0_9PEZI|nr:uncharacterized protein LY79DRAFT_539044 [Colletotrichum navitas]KAK1598391.1 hypothetical protein LY79DRAFT_539044 [Colletotrichum navitas]
MYVRYSANQEQLSLSLLVPSTHGQPRFASRLSRRSETCKLSLSTNVARLAGEMTRGERALPRCRRGISGVGDDLGQHRQRGFADGVGRQYGLYGSNW